MKEDSKETSSSSEEDPKATTSWSEKLLAMFMGSSDEEKLEAEPVPFMQLFRYATGREKIVIFFGILCAIVEGLALPTLSILIGKVTTIYVNTEEPIGNIEFVREVVTFACIYLGFGFLIFILAALENVSLSIMCDRIVSRIRREFVKSVLSQDSAFLDETSAGALSSQLNNNIDRIRDGIGDKIGLLFRSLSTFISATALAFATEWRVSLIMVGTGPVCAITTGLMPRFASKPMRETLRIGEEANGLAEECISNVKTVAACNGQKTMIQRYMDTLTAGVAPSIRLGFVNGFFEGLFFFFLYLFFAAGLWYGIVGFHNGWLKEAGDVLGVVNACMYSSYILGMLAPHTMAILKARASAAIVYAIIDRKPTIDVLTDEGVDPSTVKCSIQFDDVHFSYKSRKSPVLNGLSWQVKEGETIALVGKSGCGKSTSIGLITRLFDSCGGDILLDGRPIEKYNVAKLRRMIGLVSQEPSLFHGSIRDNIQLGREISDEEVEEAARTANAHEFIMGLEKGYDTVLGPSGVALSGGQKQRIAIARAIATNPKILLLDEATSALDTHSERVVQAALNKASAGRTTVVVAHRLSTIKEVNRVFVLDQGMVIEEGNYTELCHREGGVFAVMVQMQDVEERKKRQSHVDSENDEEKDNDSENSLQRGISPLSSMRSMRDVLDAVEKDDAVFPITRGSIIKLLKVDTRKVLAQIAASCFRGLELPLIAVSMNLIFKCFYNKESWYTLMVWTMIGQIVLGLGCWVAITLSRMVGSWVNESILLKLRVNVFSSLLHRPMSYFDRAETSTAACSVILAQQPGQASPCLDYRVSLLYENIFASFGLTVVCFGYCWPNGFTCIFCAMAFILIFYILLNRNHKATAALERIDITGELAIEIFENTRTIQLLAVEGYFVKRYEQIQEDCKSALRKRAIFRCFVHALTQSFAFFTNFIATSFGSYLVYSGTVTVSQVYTSEVCVGCTGWAIMVMATSFNDITGSSTACKLLFSLIEPNQNTLHEGTKPKLDGSVKASSVYFAYPSRPNHLVAKSLSFDLQPGKSLALVGPSGGGKSTIVNLLERFYEPTSGKIELDSTPMSSISLYHIRSNVALVSQEPVLFSGSIYDNIALGCDDATIEEVRNACKMANASTFIEAFPEGYETSVGEKGRSLSGGQKQRVAIARALVRKPKIVVLDEATSALDTQSEKLVKAALEATASGRTSITIAHRLDTIKHCDEICFIEAGRIVERGNHDDLMKSDGKYASLVREQKLT